MEKRLIGTRNWDPTGESFWGVLSKLCTKNHMNWNEARSVLGGRLDRAVTTEAGRNPDDISNVCPKKMKELTGWSESQIHSGFSLYYQPYWMNNIPKPSIPVSSSIRLCHECAVSGIHLTVHQFVDWTHCPVHRALLKGTCPRCDEELGHIQLTEDFPNRTLCPNCQWALWHGHPVAEADEGLSRIAFIADYLDWQEHIKQYFGPEAGRRVWYGNPARYGQLAQAHALVPGPDWVTHCLVNADRIKPRCVSYAIQGVHSDEPPVCLPEQQSLDFGDDWKLPLPSWRDLTYLNLMESTIRKTRVILESRHPTLAGRSGVSEISSTHCVIQHGPQISCWATAHWLWRRCFDEAWPLQERWGRIRQKTLLTQTELGRLWSDTFSHLFAPDDVVKHTSMSSVVRSRMSHDWLQHWLESAYYAFVALACHATDLKALNSCNLLAELDELECLPLFAVQTDKYSCSLVALSPMEESDYFVTLDRNGFKGNDEKLLNDFRKLGPIFSAVGLHPEIRRRWQVDSRRLKARRDALRTQRR